MSAHRTTTLRDMSRNPDETVVHVVYIGVPSRDNPTVADAVRKGSQARTFDRVRAGSIEGDKCGARVLRGEAHWNRQHAK